jgi:hypothetical protein
VEDFSEMSGSEKFKQYQEKRKGKAQTWDEMVKKSKKKNRKRSVNPELEAYRDKLLGN